LKADLNTMLSFLFMMLVQSAYAAIPPQKNENCKNVSIESCSTKCM